MKVNLVHKGQPVLVVGAGKSGIAACRLLVKYGCQVTITDRGKRTDQNKDDLAWLAAHQVEQEFGQHDEKTFLQAELIVVSPGVPLDIPAMAVAREKGIPIIGELELASMFFKGEIIAITGTNGKTTVTTMIGQCLQKSGRKVFVGGNIGTPFCSHILEDEQAAYGVLEVSSFQLDTICHFKPKVGVLLNISPDHLDRYEDYKAYGDSKMRLFANQDKDDVAVLWAKDPEVMQRQGMVPSSVVYFDDERWLVDTDKKTLTWKRQGAEKEVYPLRDDQLQSPHVENCMAAICGARSMGASVSMLSEMLDEFSIPDHRLTTVGVYNKITVINDSKATNIGAVKSALRGQNNPVVLIAGGRDKGGDYGLLNLEVQRIVKVMILIGEAAPKMSQQFSALTTVVTVKNMAQAVAYAIETAVSGDVILLSPACASFDMYTSYNERGHDFVQQIEEQMAKDKNRSATIVTSRQQAV